jgi:glucan phosphoethanolaminetransferase (alkaline phosphatase superfamily)
MNKKSIIKFVFALLFAFILMFTLQTIFGNRRSSYGVVSFLTLTILVVASISYVAASLIVRILAKRNALKSAAILQNTKYSYEVIKILIVALPLIIFVYFNTFFALFIRIVNGSSLIQGLVITTGILAVSSLILIVATLIAYKKIVNDKLLPEDWNELFFWEIARGEVIGKSSINVNKKIVTYTFKEQAVKQVTELFECRINVQKQIIISESLRTSNPPLAPLN